MTALPILTAPLELPKLPAPVKDFIPYFAKNKAAASSQLLEPYKTYESELRKFYAQQPQHEVLNDGLINAVPIFEGHESDLKIRARQLDAESAEEQSKYIMPLDKEHRKSDATPAVVSSFKEFQNNFNLFSESSLSDLDWSNVVAAGSSVTTSLLPVPKKYRESKRALREYYHEHFAPASDVDLFLYGLNEQEAEEKIKQIETRIKDSILHETTTVRTKHAITIASQYPTRHVQIVLRLYDSISQIITGFDVDCACAAYDGKQVYASPRALVAFATQVNTIDLTRRSPSYENRLSKYSHRGFEVHYPDLDRSRIDPTIFERSFSRTQGLARLLVLEKLPKSADRDAYTDQRRKERGRPEINRYARRQRKLYGNLKDEEEDDVAEWVEEEDVSNYHTMVIPYGKRFTAAKINKLLYTKDLLLNAEWNRPKEREVNLHRHPCFFGTAEEVLDDCCGYCPEPVTDEEKEVAEEEGKTYISGKLTFIRDDPGRQEIGSFNPITTGDWTEMALVGNTQMLCQAIVDGDIDYVQSWCKQEGNDVNTRDYVGRTPLHLAVTSSTPEIVQCLIDNNARLVARLVDGKTALHLAAERGNVEMVKAIMTRSLANEEAEEARKDKKKLENAPTSEVALKDEDEEEDDEPSDLGDADADSDEDSMTQGSFVRIKKVDEGNDIPEDETDEPDVYDIDVLTWDYKSSPLHLAIINGHISMIKLLVEEYGADVLNPVKILDYDNAPKSAIMTLILALTLPVEKATQVAKVLLDLGATSAQADMRHFTALHYVVGEKSLEVFDLLFQYDRPAAQSVLNYVALGSNDGGYTALKIAVRHSHEQLTNKLLSLGANVEIDFDAYIKSFIARHDYAKNWTPEQSLDHYKGHVDQPVIVAANKESPELIEILLNRGADPKTLDSAAHSVIKAQRCSYWQKPYSVLDIVQNKLKLLREFVKDAEEKASVPQELKDEAFYTKGLKSGSYQHWVAVNRFKRAKKLNEAEWKSYDFLIKEKKVGRPGEKEKKQAVRDVIAKLEQVERRLIKAGAKLFKDLYPNITLNSHHYSRNYKVPDPEPYKTHFTYSVADLNKRQEEGYTRLFDAVWDNDLEEVKALTLGSWKSQDDFDNPPLKIAVTDGYGESTSSNLRRLPFSGFTPFTLAASKGYFPLARAIMEIARAQYQPEDDPARRKKWTVDTDDYSDYYYSDDDDDDGSPDIWSKIVDETFTIDNIAAVSNVVKSQVRPLWMLDKECNAFWMVTEDDEQKFEHGCTITEFAIRTDNLKLLKFLLAVGAEQRAFEDETTRSSTSFSVTSKTFDLAISLGRTQCLAELIRATGSGIPLDELVEKSGVTVQEKPRYYQGLNVGGKKRQDWAAKGRPGNIFQKTLTEKHPPFLKACQAGNIESVQWFLSDAPARRYMEFADTHKDDKRVKVLEQSDTGFEKTITTWLNARSEIALHCAILYNPSRKKDSPEYPALIKYLISVNPGALNHKSMQGWTPLHVAVACCQPDIVKLLLEAGANPRIRDANSCNVVHHMLVPLTGSQNSTYRNSPKSRTNAARLRELIALFPRDQVKDMLLEKAFLSPANSSLTPLAYWMLYNETNHKKPDILSILTEYSGGDDLETINGHGDLPLHVAVKLSLCAITKFLIAVRPALLHRENATGRTPLEAATDFYLQDRLQYLPPVGEDKPRYYWQDDEDTTSLAKKPESEFRFRSEEVIREEEENLVSKKRTYEICRDTAATLPPEARKRTLVSLYEANEVAKRLAGVKVTGRGGTVFVDGEWRREVKKEDEIYDEVGFWVVDSQDRNAGDWEKEKAEEEEKEIL